MNRKIIIGVGVAAVGLGLLVLSSDKPKANPWANDGPSGLPRGNGFEYRLTPAGLQRFQNGKPLSSATQNIAFNIWQANVFKERQALLPKERTPAGGNYFGAGDEFSKEAYWITPYIDTETNTAVVLVDEYGRMYPGHYEAAGPSTPWDAVTLVFSNPLFSVALIAGLAALGPGGLAAYGAYEAWKHRGEGLTVKSALLLAGRTYATSQCGPACGAAFDMGVGVASGKSVNQAAEDTLLNNMTPAQRAAYEQGKMQAHKMGL